MRPFSEYDEDCRTFVESLVGFDTTGGAELDAQEWLRDRLDAFGFETYEWTADAEALAGHPEFPDDPADIDVTDRPSVAGVAEFGDPDAAVVGALREALAAAGVDADPVGETYGADSRHYIHAGVPTVVFGPGDIDAAHFPNESIEWAEVRTAGDVLADAARRMLS